jgi:hypothetical protein
MPEIRVQPPSLQTTGATLTGVGDETSSLAASVQGAEGAAGAMGDPLASGAYTRMLRVWVGELLGMAERLGVLGRNVSVSGALYQHTDMSTMGGGRAPGP